jgi:hypothetical protein
MRNIKLKKGYLVEDWSGLVIEINYAVINYSHYGNVEERYLVEKNGHFMEPITKYNSNKIFDSLIEAEQHSLTVVKGTIKYYKEQIVRNQEKLKELQKL